MSTNAITLAVTHRRRLADNIIQLTLAASDGGRVPDWTPGSHIVLDLPAGPRCYSLCGDRWDAYTYSLAVQRDPSSRGGSSFVHDKFWRSGPKVLPHSRSTTSPWRQPRTTCLWSAGSGSHR